MRRSRAAAMALVLAGVVACGEDRSIDVSPGVPLSLAQHRSATITDLDYSLAFRIPDDRGAPIRGSAVLGFTLADPDLPLVIDFDAPAEALRSVTLGGTPVEYTHADEHILIPADALSAGPVELGFEFDAADDPLNRGEDFLYTLFVPARARRAFPSFDQPDLKASFELALEVPEGWVAVSNGRAVEEALGEDGRGRYRFAPTRPIPTYLFAFAAGEFQIESAERAGRTLRLFHRETDPDRVARNLESIFDLHGTALEWLEAYTDIPYPFDEFDFVAVPSFQYGGMEHPGSVFYRAASLFLEESATKNQQLGRASLIAHETAHMWFGDLVTMRWFDDVWMKEVFANFMAAKIVNPSFPELDHDLRFLLAHYPGAYSVDRTEGANPIRQELDNLADAGTLYGAIIYQKAPIVMRHLELQLGESGMRDGLRDYLDRYAFGNASWPELIEILDARTDRDLSEWSRVWVAEPGRPTIRITSVDAGSLQLTQSDPRQRRIAWSQPLEVLRGGPTDWRHASISLDATAQTVSLDGEDRGDDLLLANGAGIGYGLFPLAAGNRDRLLEELPAIRPSVPRAVAWLTLWDGTLEGDVSPEDLISLGMRAIATEEEELILSQVLADVSGAYWRFLDDKARARIAPGLEELLWAKMHEAEGPSRTSSLYLSFRSIALTERAVGRLRALWRGEIQVSGLVLSERDLTGLAHAIAVRDRSGAQAMLDEQAERITNPDRRARFEFIRPALSPDPAVRDAFFDSLAEPENRAREPWVLAALSLIHHPIHAAQSQPYIQPSLELLEEIQRTGDIFFPGRWLGATLSGHGSRVAAETVRAFLNARPDYPPRLRAKILQSSDMLFRAAAIRETLRG